MIKLLNPDQIGRLSAHVKSAIRTYPVQVRGEVDMPEIPVETTMDPWEVELKKTVDSDPLLPPYSALQGVQDGMLLDALVEYYEKCPNDTDGDRNCQHCAGKPNGCLNLGKAVDQVLRVWWIPQIPMKPFRVPVRNITEAKLLLDALAKYDAFQFENNIKPDYSNVGGLEVFEDGEWVDWYDKNGNSIDLIET